MKISPKYKILIDYGSEGRKYFGETREGDDFDSVDEAVQTAIKYSSCSPFQIIKIVDWEAKEINE